MGFYLYLYEKNAESVSKMDLLSSTTMHLPQIVFSQDVERRQYLPKIYKILFPFQGCFYLYLYFAKMWNVVNIC